MSLLWMHAPRMICHGLSIVDNFDNNSDPRVCIRELSDLYMCKIPMHIKTPGCIDKHAFVEFASLEHAITYQRIGFPLVADAHNGACAMLVSLPVIVSDAMVFVHQFQADGVFASWDSISHYCNPRKITKGHRGPHNIGLIARRIFCNKHQGYTLRLQFVCSASALWINNNDMVVRCIAACLRLKLTARSCRSYRAQIRRLLPEKLNNNTSIDNVLYHNRTAEILVSCRNCPVVSTQRRQMDLFYNAFMCTLQKSILWRAEPMSLIIIYMGIHPVLGKHSALQVLNANLLQMIISLADTSRQT